MIFTKEVMNNPEVLSYSEIKEDDGLITVEELDHMKDTVPMQNEPQLSGEQYKKYAVRFCNCNEGQFSKMATHSQSCDFIQGSFVDHQEQMRFLATALEEQKQGYEKWANEKIAKCERLKESNFVNESPDYFRGKIAILNDLLAILNGKEANE